MTKKPKKKANTNSSPNKGIGIKIRELRKSHKMSLQDLAQKTELTPSSVSQIERGLSNPSLSALRRMAQAMGVPVFYFLMNDEVNESELIVRANRRKMLKAPNSNVVYELLSPSLSKQMEIIQLELNPGQASSKDFFTHDGEEACLVLSGDVTVLFGDVSYELSTGDCVQYSAIFPHKFFNHDEAQMARLLFMITPPSF